MTRLDRILPWVALALSCILLVVLVVSMVVHSREEPGAVALVPRLERDAESRTVEPRVVATTSSRQVRMANRTLEVEEGKRKFPKRFAELQSPSGRRTVPYVVVANEPVSSATRRRVSACGARVIGFMPVNSLIVEAGERALRRLEQDEGFTAAYELAPADKIQSTARETAARTPAKVDVTVVPLMVTDVELLAEFVKSQGGAVIPADDERPVLRARVSAATMEALARRGDVRWIERYVPARLQNNVVVNAEPNLMNVRAVWDAHGLTGEGQNITVTDTGVDTCNVRTMLADFTGRVYKVERLSFSTAATDINGHGTHVAGSLVGTGALSDGEIKGVAHGARIYMWQCLTKSGDGLILPSVARMFQPDERNFPSFIHSASWGHDAIAAYTTSCGEVDEYVWRHPAMLPVFAVGNSEEGSSAAGTATDPATAKNVIAVGATESYRPTEQFGSYADNPAQMAYFSLRGPTTDGRVKPDLCAPGTRILSTLSTQCGTNNFGWGVCSANPHYVYDGGTSMAAPLVAGAAALVREWLVKQRGFTNSPPTAALVKAVLTGGARDLSVFAGADCGGAAPNSRQGWGSVNLSETLFPSNRSVKLVDALPFAAGSEQVVRVMTTNAAPFDVQLVWIDYPGDVSAREALVNDLDLVVSNETTGAVWRGNGADGGDRRNNVESVRIARAEAGVWAIRVVGVRVPYDSGEGGAAALYVRGALAAGTQDESGGRGAAPWYSLTRRSQFPQLRDWGLESVTWHPSGAVVRVSVPADLPDGGEVLENLIWMNDETGEETPLGPQRLAEVRVVDDRGAEEVRRDAAGRMATEFDVSMDGEREVRFAYYDAATMDAATGLPEWWWRRYLAADPNAGSAVDTDGDGVSNGAEYAADTDPADPVAVFRILEFSASNIVWSGGKERTQVVERSQKLGARASWHGVYTNLPPTAATNRCMISPEGSSNYFYRVRAF